jgi:thiamine biosynthesis lipoprotein
MSTTTTTSLKSLSRRDFLKITALAGAALGIGATAAHRLLQLGELQKISETQYLMGTLVNFVVIAQSEAEGRNAIDKTAAEMERLIQIHDYRKADSPLGRLNATGATHHAPPELVATLRQALHFGELSRGAFDITVKPLLDALRENRPPSQALKKLVDYRLLHVSDDEIRLARHGMSVTLDGIAKGSVVDGGVAILRGLGFENVLVEAGGDMMANSAPDGETWKIGVTHPRLNAELAASFSVQNKAVATSGDYMNRFSADYSSHHIIDPHSGASPSQLASVTVIASSAAEADALSTTLMALGVQDGLALIEQLPDAAAFLITKDLEMVRSRRFPLG